MKTIRKMGLGKKAAKHLRTVLRKYGYVNVVIFRHKTTKLYGVKAER